MNSFAQVFLLVSIAFAKLAFADLEESFCGCVGQNDCCILTEYDFNIETDIATGTDNDFVQTVDYGNFSAAISEPGVQKSNMNFFAFSALDCVNSRGLLFANGGSATPVASAYLTQTSATVCTLNFTGLLSDEDLRETLDLVVGFNALSDPLGTVVSVQFLEDFVPYTLPAHRWIVEEKQGDDSVVEVDLNIQWLSSSGHNDSCLTESNLDGIRYQFTVDSGAPGSASTCNFQTDSIIVNDANRTAHIEFEFGQADYVRCYRQAPENVGSDIRYTYEVVPVIDGCDYYESYPSHVFTVTLDNTVQVNNTANVNSMIIDILQDTASIIPCADEFDDINPLVPLAKLDFYVEIDTAYGTEATSVVLTTLQIQDIGLEVIGDVNLTSIAGSNTKARFRLRTAECLFVDTVHSGEPASQTNLQSCSIDYLQPATIVALATYQDGFTESNDAAGDDRQIVFESSSLSECDGVVIASNDVTQLYGARLVVEDSNGRTDSLNLNNPIIARIELTNSALAESSGVSVVYSDLVVTLDDEYRRTYTVADKILQMQLDFSPYETDGHFCRYFEDSTDTCERFYQQTSTPAEYAAEHWNAYLQTLYDVGTGGFFITDDSGRKYDGCQAATTTSSDSFVFTPSDWVFKSFPRRTGTMFFQATAYLRACTAGGSRRLREIKLVASVDSRELQNNNDVAVVFNNVTIINSDVVITGGDNGCGANIQSTQSTNNTLLIIIIALVSVALAAMCCFGLCGFGLCARLYSKTTGRDDADKFM